MKSTPRSPRRKGKFHLPQIHFTADLNPRIATTHRATMLQTVRALLATGQTENFESDSQQHGKDYETNYWNP